jgi:hypothetical protein
MLLTDARSIMVSIAVAAWRQIVQLGPYVLGGVLLAAVAGQLELARRWLAGLSRAQSAPRRDVLWMGGAACLGMLSPLSTYGAVPLLAQWTRHGAARGPALAFLCASSMLNPQLFLLVAGGLGMRTALLQAAGILVLSLAVGWMAARLPATWFQTGILQPAPAARRFSWSRLIGDAARMLDWIGLTFIVGVLLTAAIEILLPMSWATWLAALPREWSVPLAGLLGVPLYTCGGSAVPVVRGLVELGLGRDAALAFLLAGPATRVTALAAVGSLVNRRALALYIIFILIGATALGWLLGPM